MTTAIEYHPYSAKRTTSTPGMFRVGQQTASCRDWRCSIALSVRAQDFAPFYAPDNRFAKCTGKQSSVLD